MKSIIFALLLINFAAICTAQITFTREWVAGKRSTAKNAADIQEASPSTTLPSLFCRTLRPVIEYLLEEEKFRNEACRHGKVSRRIIENMPYLFVTKPRDKGVLMSADDSNLDIPTTRGAELKR